MKIKALQIAAIAVAAACAGTAMNAQDTNTTDKKFIADSAQGSLAEVNFAKLALEKSGDKNVRDFASKMVKDHEKLIEDMKPFAMKLQVKLPSGPSIADRAKYNELKLKSGISFDRAYVEAMVKDHDEDLKKFIAEEQSTANPDLKATVANGEKVIRAHTEMIDSIAHMGGISTPPMPTN